MPELPEVEWGRKIALAAGRGRRIERVWAAEDRIVFTNATPKDVVSSLTGARLEDVRRKGKYIWFELDRGPSAILHLGMTGALHSKAQRFVPLETGGKDPAGLWPPRFVKLHLHFEGGAELLMVDARRLGRIRMSEEPLAEAPLSRLGPDVYDEPLSPSAFAARLEKRSGLIKSVLLDQGFVAGVGNWIADEVLYQAGIDPRRPVKTLRPDEVQRLRGALNRVVRKAVSVDADKARFPRSWLFHHRWGKQADARTAEGERIEHVVVGGRTTAFVPSVQR